MNFIGNKKILDLLSNSLKRGSLNHAYLFCGPENVGKFTLAKMFAFSAIEGKELELEINEPKTNSLLDLAVIEPEVVEKNGISKQKDISIEAVRDVKQNLGLFPNSGKYRVLIVNDAHRLGLAAQNALLKTLEEPNRTTIIILVTHKVEKILPTILSRCQVMNFNLAAQHELAEQGFAQEDINLAMGRPGILIRMRQDPKERDFSLEAMNDLNRLSKGSINERFALAEEFSKDNVKCLAKLNIWLWELRKKANSDLQNYRVIEKIQKAIEVMSSSNANSRLILEILFMDI